MDYQIFTAINQLAGHSALLDGLMAAVAKYGPVLMVVPLLLIWFRGGVPAKKAALLSLLAMGIGLIANQVIGDIWFRSRPFTMHDVNLLIPASSDPSFPSDHATFVFGIAWLLLFRDRRIGALALSIAALVAFSRVFVGIHYPMDVVGGAGVGLAAAAGVWYARRLLDPVTGLLISIARKMKLA